MKKLFGTDGIRGQANCDPITVPVMASVARAATRHLGIKKVVIGKDTRRSCYMLETALSSGFLSMGADVMLMGPMPTPGIAFLASSMRADAGVVISASHNRFDDNGIKFFDRQGFKLSHADEEAIEKMVDEEKFDLQLPRGEKLGRLTRIRESKGRYIVFAKNSFPQHLTLEGIKIVVDCGHGATYKVAPMVLQELGAEVILMNAEPNGININDNCGALYPEHMCKRVKETGAFLGVAFDGDGDRAILCDERGEIVDGDAILAVAALFFKRRGQLANHGVVATTMSNIGLNITLQQQGINLVRCDVGDRNVVQSMLRNEFVLGGEQSGHIVFLNYSTTGDGIVTLLQLLSIAIQEDKPLSELCKVIQLYPQCLLNVKVREKRNLDDMKEVVAAIQSAEEKLGDKGRIHVRYSGTEALARVMVEGESDKLIHDLANQVVDAIRQEVGVD